MRYDQLPDRLKRQVDRMMSSDRPLRQSDLPPTVVAKPPAPKMTKTEQQFEARLVAMYGRECVRFESMTLRLANGHRYTPDFVVRHGDRLAIYEVKGSYRLHSHGRARLAFDQARTEWPMWSWVWAEKQKDGTFKVS
jgi:hypothetical protein